MRELVLEALDEIGINIPEDVLTSNKDFDLRDYIQDSLAFISSLIQIEEKLNVSLPDEVLTFNTLSSFQGFCQLLENITSGEMSQS